MYHLEDRELMSRSSPIIIIHQHHITSPPHTTHTIPRLQQLAASAQAVYSTIKSAASLFMFNYFSFQRGDAIQLYGRYTQKIYCTKDFITIPQKMQHVPCTTKYDDRHRKDERSPQQGEAGTTGLHTMLEYTARHIPSLPSRLRRVQTARCHMYSAKRRHVRPGLQASSSKR